QAFKDTKMVLVWFILILMIGGVLAWVAARWSVITARWIALLSTLINLVTALVLWIRTPLPLDRAVWIENFDAAWIPSFGISFSLALDGLSLLMLMLTFLLGVAAVLTSWREVEYKPGFFHFNVLW